jgi:hypothetical protein
VEGFLVSGDDDTIHLLISPCVLHLRRADIVAIEELPPLPRQDTRVGIAVRLSLTTGCTLLGIAPSDNYEPLLWRKRRPFPIMTRDARAPLRDDGSYAELESSFLRDRGIEVEL